MAAHPIIGIRKPQQLNILCRCTEKPTVLPDVAEVRLQIFRRDEVKLIGGTGAQLCNKGGSVLFM